MADFITKVVSMIEATDALVREKQAQDAKIAEVSAQITDTLIKAGCAKEDQRESLCAGFAAEPTKMATVFGRLIEENKKIRVKAAAEVAAAEKVKAEVPSLGKPSEKKASAGKPEMRESDRIWLATFGK